VLLPASVGFAVEFGFYLYGAIHLSVSRTGTASVSSVMGLLGRVARLAVGLHYSLAGFLLIAVFTLWVRLGIGSLPLALPKTNVHSTDAVSWPRLCIFVWILITWFPALWAGRLMLLVLDLVPGFPHLARNVWGAAALGHLLPFGACLLLATSLFGKEVWKALRRAIRLPKPEMFLLLALILPSGVLLAALTIDYFLFGFQPLAARVPDYSVFLFYLFVAALCEEVIFRGLLQPWFISRYGPVRGIFIVSIVWAGGHLWGDFWRIPTDADAFLQLGGRLLGCIAGGMLLGWLAVRSRSIWPGVIAHVIYNSFAWPNTSAAFVNYVPILILGVLTAGDLFRYWPVHVGQEQPEKFICAT
jgi:membrane protease YdiL (CAAX protease family)